MRQTLTLTTLICMEIAIPKIAMISRFIIWIVQPAGPDVRRLLQSCHAVSSLKHASGTEQALVISYANRPHDKPSLVPCLPPGHFPALSISPLLLAWVISAGSAEHLWQREGTWWSVIAFSGSVRINIIRFPKKQFFMLARLSKCLGLILQANDLNHQNDCEK